jgi:hypothetical protein
MGRVVHPDADHRARAGDRGTDAEPVGAGQLGKLAGRQRFGDPRDPATGQEGGVDVRGQAGQVERPSGIEDDGGLGTRWAESGEFLWWCLPMG